MSKYWRSTYKRYFWIILFGLSLIVCLWLGSPVLGRQITLERQAQLAQTLNPDQLVQQGVDRYQANQIHESIQSWQTALEIYQQNNQTHQSAIVLENLARAYQRLGQASEALNYWQKAVSAYQQLNDPLQVSRMTIEQAQTLNQLGQHRQAIALLCGPTGPCEPTSALEIARSQNDRLGEAAALGGLGEARRLRGDYDRAIADLEASLAIARETQNIPYEASAFNSLGHIYLGMAQMEYRRSTSASLRGDQQEANRRQQAGLEADRQALAYFSEGLTIAQQHPDGFSQMQLLLGSIPAYYHTDQRQAAQTTLQQAKSLLPTLPDSQAKVYATINLVHLLQPPVNTQQVSPLRCLDSAVETEAETLLKQAIALSQQISNPRAESFALGELGHLYECRGDATQALAWTQEARWAAEQALQSQDSLYLWEWQTARILKSQLDAQSDDRDYESVIANYEKAIATLETIRNDLLTANRDLQFDFRDTIDPLYRQLVSLRLELGRLSTDPASTGSQTEVFKALKTLDSLKLAELQNYFGDNCIIVAPTQETVAKVGADRKTAVFNSVILADRTAIVATLPDGRQPIAWIDQPQSEIDQEINEYRRELERSYKIFDPRYAQQLYRWIIAPFADELKQQQVKTLVFIQDGILRSVPMAALYNPEDQSFLVEKYAIATTPSLTLTAAQPLDRKNLKALAIGLTQATVIDGKNFPALKNVAGEISAIEAQLPGSKGLLDQAFTSEQIQLELEQSVYPIVHIATHGEFGTEPEDTFLVTGDNQKLTITQLDGLLRTTKSRDPIELLALTACQTATGDDRSALGLAGVAIQAGAKSALASLWFIDDAATAKITEQFYAGLRTNLTLSKADALQAAQLHVMRSGGQIAHPAYWAPFILIGNWL